MKIQPNAVFEGVTNISNAFLKQHEIQAVILDIDNTVTADGSMTVEESVMQWVKSLDIPVFLLSNGKSARVSYFADMFGADYLSGAKKPFPGGYRKAAKKLGVCDMSKIAVIGDQLLSDILGGRLAGCFTVKVQPIDPTSDPMSVKFKRALEKLFV